MQFVRLMIVVALVCTSGCTAARLRQRTINQGSSLPELQFQQVLSNLAMFADNPAALPWHVNLREGTTQLTDSLSGGSLVDLGPPAVTQPQIFGSRTVVAQWGMAPVIDTVELSLLRVAYRRAFGAEEMPSPDLLEELAHELKDQMAANPDLRDETEVFFEFESRSNRSPADLDRRIVTTNDTTFCDQDCQGCDGDEAEGDGSDGDGKATKIRRAVSPLARNVCRKIEMIERDLARIEPGWFHVGCKRDVPKTACYVGRHEDRYVWVEADGRDALTDFTLTVMKLSTLIKETQTLINPGSVKFSPGDKG